MPSLAGQKLDKYDMLEEVGHGGMAVVYRGRDTILDREVAVKVLHAHLADREESRRRLQREAKTVAKLHHDNIVEIFDSSDPTSADESYIVCEFIHGVTLRDWLDKETPSRPVLAAMIAHRLCLPLDHAHSLGIVHRDIKPENVMIREDGCLKLMDFGIAQILDTQRLTTTGQLLGSPAYMAPELISGKPVDKRIDIFALGVMLYQLATNELPFSGRNPAQVLNRILEGDYKRPSRVDPRVDDDLEAIIAKALSLSAKDRYQTASGMAKDLEGYLASYELEATSEELAAYFADPEGYVVRLDDRVCRVLTRNAAKAMRNGHGARALKLLGRVLELNPKDRRAAAMLDKVRIRGQRMRQAAAVAGLLAAAGIIAAGVMLLQPDPPTPDSIASDDPLHADARYSHIPDRDPQAEPVPPLVDLDTGTDSETGEDEDTGEAAGSGGRPPRLGPNKVVCAVEVKGLPAAVLSGGDYSLKIAGATTALPATGKIRVPITERTRIALVGASYEGSLYLDPEACKNSAQVLQARTRAARAKFTAPVPLSDLTVTCVSGCKFTDRAADSVPDFLLARDETSLQLRLEFKAVGYRELTKDVVLYPGTTTIRVPLEKL